MPAFAGISLYRGWQSRQLHPGTRIIHYRCCLPALAEFANYRRERTNGTALGGDAGSIRASIAETGGAGGIRTREAGISRLHTFQACSFNHSDTAPHNKTYSNLNGGRDCSSHPETRPARFALRASLRLSKFVPDEFVEPAKRV